MYPSLNVNTGYGFEEREVGVFDSGIPTYTLYTAKRYHTSMAIGMFWSNFVPFLAILDLKKNALYF